MKPWILILLAGTTMLSCSGADREELSRRERTLTEPVTRKSDEYIYSATPPQYRPDHERYPWR